MLQKLNIGFEIRLCYKNTLLNYIEFCIFLMRNKKYFEYFMISSIAYCEVLKTQLSGEMVELERIMKWNLYIFVLISVLKTIRTVRLLGVFEVLVTFAWEFYLETNL
ncbi:LOW QUALITY PROTEIN: uncharacterized protein T551_03110 [Pneumocystis jirovecii RU7]|uniref:Uncharacterized protein n=1 Tax=Pneumocystis jirovecii (strain RU7) TaxID=1408657 RepID=A0A0W4ZFF8_PNEJ7|nr:LOW QUALITY PROTEIN: uncharacterized protein T551_03110 [Pneumocystis jirovecii RU7]KTW27116.1 LOW QUALITY PROTEIN: hypothetical protein T551_03110 [Pneumocystis jirovecii RU7]